ncbi:hypothetical protein A3Q56_05197, partial [Intoshia linei]
MSSKNFFNSRDVALVFKNEKRTYKMRECIDGNVVITSRKIEKLNRIVIVLIGKVIGQIMVQETYINGETNNITKHSHKICTHSICKFQEKCYWESLGYSKKLKCNHIICENETKCMIDVRNNIIPDHKENNIKRMQTIENTFMNKHFNIYIGNDTIKPGENYIPFSIPLTPNTDYTTSYSKRKTKISYSLHALVNGSIGCVRSIQIISSINPTFEISFVKDGFVNEKTCCLNGPLIIWASIEDSIITLGKPFNIMCKFENKNNIIYDISMEVQRNIRVKCNNKIIDKERQVLAKKRCGKVECGGVVEFEQHMTLPESVYPTYSPLQGVLSCDDNLVFIGKNGTMFNTNVKIQIEYVVSQVLNITVTKVLDLWTTSTISIKDKKDILNMLKTYCERYNLLRKNKNRR